MARLQLYLADEPAERAEIARIPRIDVALATALWRVQFRRLEQHRQAREPGVVEQSPEWLEPETALADVLVPIDAAPARPPGVVQVEDFDPPQSDDRVELAKRRVVAIRSAQVVACGQQVTGIETHANAGRALQELDDPREMLEPMPEVRALASRVFEQDPCAAATRRENLRETLRDQPQTILLVARGVRAGMHDQTIES